MKLVTLAAVAALAAAPATAVAQTAGPASSAPAAPLGAPLYESFDGGGRGFIRVDLPEMAAPAAAAPPSRVLYVNDCKPNGCQLTPGNFSRPDDSRTNVSSIVRGTGPRTLSAFTGSQATWDAIIQCVRENYAPFDIQVVTTEPASTTSYFEAMAAGRPTELGFSTSTAGVASFSCGIIPNAISFSFLNLNPTDVLDACWTISQESAHNFGLSHEMLGGDAMTYMPNPPRKRFLDQTACVGTQGCCQPSQECQCGPTEQNSFRELLAIFGTAPPTPPEITITSPDNNAVVDAGFPVRASIVDANGVASAELSIDGALVQTVTSAPYVFNAPLTLADGPHMITVHATDTLGADASVTIRATQGGRCTTTPDCATIGEGFVCVSGICVPGAGVPGGLGAACDTPEECLSGQCATRGGENHCVEACDPSASSSCGDGFDCVTTGGGGLCWPSDPGACGCASDGGSAPTLPIGVGLVLSAVVLRRRRRAA
ncbi:MAG: Ig-like domain-containing protein [Kofleriaceae bacterium]